MVHARVVEHFPASELEWLDRAALKRRPAATLAKVLRRRYDHAVLVAPDLRSPRLRLTSMLLALPRAARRWRLDLGPETEPQPFQVGRHLRTSAFAVARHLLACGLALMLAYPALWLLYGLLLVTRASRRAAEPRRMLYLRSQLWLGLQGGGSVAHTAGVVGALQAVGIEVHAVASDELAGVEAPTRIVRPECWFDGVLREAEELAYAVPFSLAVLRAAREVRPDAIYQRHATFNCTGALVARLLGVPLVLEFNSSEVWKGRYWGGLRLTGLAELAERINLRAADLVVVVSRAVRDQLLDGGLDPNKVLVNPNGVEPRRFRPDLGGNAVRSRLGLQWSTAIGFSGTFGVWHGVPTLAAALPRILVARPHARALLIGDGPLRRLVEEALAREGLQSRVALTGLVPFADMPDYLAACDIVLSPHGRQADGGEFFGSPTKLYEYMASGRAIVASAVGQIAESLRDGKTALLVPPDDPDALCQAVLRLVDDAGLRTQLGSAARAEAERIHTWRGNADRLLEALRRLSRSDGRLSQPWQPVK
jgi:glycosyltransferase involved in cell wall biosynthesis